jgi:AraC family transcriptional regulator
MITDASRTSAARRRLISIDEILHARPQQPVATTRDRGWGGVTLDLHRAYFKCAESYAGLDHHLITYHPSGSARLIQGRGDQIHDTLLTAGSSLIMPAGYDSIWEGDYSVSARLRVPISLIATAAEQLGCRPTRVEIRNVFEVRDAVIERLAQVVLSEIEMPTHPVQKLIIDNISVSLAAHLLRCYNVFEVVENQQDRLLGKRELARLTEFIEEHLDRPIALAELAAVVNLSRFHFSRLFKRSTGTTAVRYVEQCRIRRAQTLISETDLSLSDIALLTGFADQSHFTRRFHRHVGCTPAVFARERGRRRTAR